MSESAQQRSFKRHRPKVPLDQRKRTVKACTSCRLRKRRCILGSSDRCRNCRNRNLTCIFEEDRDSPSPPTSHHTSIDHEDVVARFNMSYPEIGLKAHHSSFLLEIIMDSSRTFGEEGTSKKGCAVCQNTRYLSPHESTSTSENAYPKQETQKPSDDLLAHRDFLAHATAAVSQTKTVELIEAATPFYPTEESDYGDENVLMGRILKDFPSRATGEALVSAFFFYAEANWYYFDEPSFRDQLFGLYDSGLSPNVTNPKFICLALAVFATGSQFVHLYQADHLDNPEKMTAAQTGIPGMRYFQHAQTLVPHIVASPCLEGLLGCLLLALYVLPIHNTNTCYTYLGLSLRIAICLGLHRKPARSDLSPTLSEIRNRVFWTTYSIERRVALSLGYPETLHSDDIDCPFPQRRPDLDTPFSYRAERLLAYTKLTLLLNQTICSRTLDKSSRDIQNQLLSWKEALPSQLKTLNGPSLRLNVHLQLHYSMVWIVIGRAALIGRVRRLLSKTESSKVDGVTSKECDELSDSCVEHATHIIDLINLLRTRGQLGRFSYTDFHTCSSAAVVVLLESILYPRLTSFSKIRMAMDALRYMATGSDYAKNSLKYVNDFQVVVNKALASMYRRDHETSCSVRVSGSPEFGDLPKSQDSFMQSSTQPFHPPDSIFLGSHPEVDPEDVDVSHHQGGEEISRMPFFDEMETSLENCSFTELHLLGFDCLYSSEMLNWDNVGP
ncbi:hypothetical protein PMG11_08435 [Penicillium brasilianum]|uniref:Zn(2)-C6 fungal-type domain-containing protein n=1 Tax=Penicillium brasilianum TaxID=104259 RepID=A0A0F7TXN0_PENBI|nr:hypothetical protein PMG11_08435 [Penicillium brasilianum]